MAREEFKTTLEEKAKEALRIMAAVENRDMNDILEEMIEERRQKHWGVGSLAATGTR